MAASYIRIVFVALIGIAVLMFGIGFAVGKRGNKSPSGTTVLLVGGSVPLLLILIVAARTLAVTGSLIHEQIIFLFFEVIWALLCGQVVGQSAKIQLGRLLEKSRRGAIALMIVGSALLCLLTVYMQIKNIQPVLDTLQTAGLLKPKDDYKPETNKDCPANLQSVYNAFEQYAELNDKLPDAAKWQDDTDFTSRIPQDEWLHCPAVSNRHDDKFGYALNDAIAGKKLNLNGKPLKSLPGAATTPLLYDSTTVSKNAHDVVTSLPKPGRHGGRNNILYLDGHVAAVAPK